jgi:putative membrane protein
MSPKRMTFVAVAALCALPLVALAKTPAKSSADRMFARKAAIGGMAEVELGKLATQKASNDQVKQFGQRMVDDHSKANDELKQAASQEGIDLPADLDAKHKALQARLSAMSGAAFDRAYMKEMVRDHVEDVAAFQKQANRKSNTAVNTFAQKTLPTLKEHLKMARDTNRAVSK